MNAVVARHHHRSRIIAYIIARAQSHTSWRARLYLLLARTTTQEEAHANQRLAGGGIMLEPDTGRLPNRVLLSSPSSGGGLRQFFSEAGQKKPSDSFDLTTDEIIQVAGSSAPAHGSGHASGPGEGCSRPFGASAGGRASWSLAAAAPGSDKPVWDMGDRVLYNGTSPKKEWVLVTVTSTEVVQGIRLYHVQGECAPKKSGQLGSS